MGTVNKSDLIRTTAESIGVSQAFMKDAVEKLISTIAARAEAGDTVKLPGFGSFSVKARPARVGRNPATGAAVDIPETRRIVFKAARKAAAD